MVLADTEEAAVYGLMVGLATMTVTGLANFSVKLACIHKCDPAIVNTCWFGVCSAVGVSYLCILLLNGHGLQGLALPMLTTMSLMVGLLQTIGLLFLGRALRTGPGGVVVSVANTGGLLVSVLDIVVFQRLPNGVKVFGMLIVFIGLILLVIVKSSGTSRPAADCINVSRIGSCESSI